MAAIYKRWVLEGKMTLEEVPVRWRSAVEALLNA